MKALKILKLVACEKRSKGWLAGAMAVEHAIKEVKELIQYKKAFELAVEAINGVGCPSDDRDKCNMECKQCWRDYFMAKIEECES